MSTELKGVGVGVRALNPSVGVIGTLRTFSGSNKHLDWSKTNLNVAEIIYRVKVRSQAGTV